MNGKKVLLLIIILLLIQLSIIACSSQQAASTPVPPTATSVPPTATAIPPRPMLCEDVEGSCVEIRFESNSCHRIGPEFFSAGEINFIYSNYTDLNGAVDIEKLDEGKTYQDMLIYMRGLDAYSGSQPPWSSDVTGGGVDAGAFRNKPKELEEGTYIAVCWRTKPSHEVFLADGVLIVEE